MIILNDKESIKKAEEMYCVSGAPIEQDLNLFGIRNSQDVNKGVWNDLICLYDKRDGKIYLMEGTTEPGRHYTYNPMNKDGALHMVPGFYPNLWRPLRKRFRQVGKLWIWRDKNKNFKQDNEEKDYEVGRVFVQLHGINRILSRIFKASAGCQVIRIPKEYTFIYDLCKKSGQGLFSYLLMDLKTENKYFYDMVFERSRLE
ncbi:MAG: hypothetical protein JSW06_02930 [Thermoplasmatales archaeon]|nr:MAG: hypothetical protein JSW06_02930 [Thermoplasmatales archaeon]